MDIEDDMDNEFNEEEDFDLDFEDDLGIINYDIRNDSYIKAVIINIKDTYKKIIQNIKWRRANYIIERSLGAITYIIIDLLGTGISGLTFKALSYNC